MKEEEEDKEDANGTGQETDEKYNSADLQYY